ncbi:MAG: V-type ATP synthase subunit D [Candidatus Verstraetearchaeota archaeon]|nr:V-type ATP synthase subunit D [Candidatus Verstraetearchaeota archaeon]
MSLRVAPSKMNLIRFKRTLAFLSRAHDLLEEKRDILLLEVNRRIGEATKLREDLDRTLKDAYTALDSAAATVGSKEIESAAKIPKTTFELSVSKKKVMGVSVLSMNLENMRGSINYGFSRPTILLDESSEKFQQALLLVVKVAELENTLVNLVEEVKRTQRRINALEQFLIPRYSSTVAMISNILEERDREEFVRVKKVKRILEKRSEAEIVV